jgi:hypothetical protein
MANPIPCAAPVMNTVFMNTPFYDYDFLSPDITVNAP